MVFKNSDCGYSYSVELTAGVVDEDSCGWRENLHVFIGGSQRDEEGLGDRTLQQLVINNGDVDTSSALPLHQL